MAISPKELIEKQGDPVARIEKYLDMRLEVAFVSDRSYSVDPPEGLTREIFKNIADKYKASGWKDVLLINNREEYYIKFIL